MAILFADSFDGYQHGPATSLNSGNSPFGLVVAGYDEPYRDSLWCSASVFSGQGRANGRHCVRVSYNNRSSWANISTTGLKRKIDFSYFGVFGFNTVIRLTHFGSSNLELDSGRKIPLLELGSMVVYAENITYVETGNPGYRLHFGASSIDIESGIWQLLEIEIDYFTETASLWVNNKKVGDIAHDGSVVDFFHFTGVLLNADTGARIDYVGSLDVDYLVIYDQSTDTNNSRLGKLKFATLTPTVVKQRQFTSAWNTDESTILQLTDVTKNNNGYSNNFIHAAQAGTKDLYGTEFPESIPKFLTVCTVAQMSEPNTFDVQPVVFDGTVEQVGDPIPNLRVTTWTEQKWVRNKAPNGEPWSLENLSIFQWGQKLAPPLTWVQQPTTVGPQQPSEPPGSQTLLFGDESLGYYGTVSANEFVTGAQLASALGFTAGNSYDNTPDWLKFAHNGKTLYVPKRPLREGVSWLDIYNAGLVYGVSGNGNYPPTTGGVDQLRTVTIAGRNYKVRLLKGADVDPNNLSYNVAHPAGTHNSEWAQLVLRTSANDPNNSHWENFTDIELGMDDAITDRISWCQETWASRDGTYRVARGVYGQALTFGYVTYTSNLISLMWRPVLELIDN